MLLEQEEYLQVMVDQRLMYELGVHRTYGLS